MEEYAAIVVEHSFGELIKTQKLRISNVERTEEATIRTMHPKIILNAALMLRLDASVSCVDIHGVLKLVSKMKCYENVHHVHKKLFILILLRFYLKALNDCLQVWNQNGF